MIAETIFLCVGVIGMPGAERLGDIAVVFAALVFVAYQQRDRRAGSLAFEDAGEDFDGVRFAALRDVTRSAGFTPVQIVLDIALAQRESGWATIDHTAYRRAVRFAK